jgi:hypothetical protein
MVKRLRGERDVAQQKLPVQRLRCASRLHGTFLLDDTVTNR